MKKSELRKIIKEELKSLKEVKDGGVLEYFYKQGYSAGQMLNPLVDELIKTKGLEGAKNHIGSLVGDEPQYDMSSRTPFREEIQREIDLRPIEKLSFTIYDYVSNSPEHSNAPTVHLGKKYWNPGMKRFNEYVRNTSDEELKQMVSQWWELRSKTLDSPSPKYAYLNN
jgi:hypothetical protein